MSKKIATIDLGSNSFHMLISEISDNGQAETLCIQKQKVQLRRGLTDELDIDEETQQRAIKCLRSFYQCIQEYSVDEVVAVGTYTLRKAQENIKEFKEKLDEAIGVNIKIISGEEEARLVYVGANSGSEKQTLIVDIGGGSTEFVIGKNDDILISKSLDIGCVGVQKEFFADDKLSIENFEKAIAHAKDVISEILPAYKKVGWNIALGSSGTIKSVMSVNNALYGESSATKVFLEGFISQLIAKENVENIKFEGLREDKESVVAGGLAILYAIFDSFKIDEMQCSNGAVREGALFEAVRDKFGIEIK